MTPPGHANAPRVGLTPPERALALSQAPVIAHLIRRGLISREKNNGHENNETVRESLMEAAIHLVTGQLQTTLKCMNPAKNRLRSARQLHQKVQIRQTAKY